MSTRSAPPTSSASGSAFRSALLGDVEPRAGDRAERERPQVLELVEAVARPLEPVESLEAEGLGLGDRAEVVPDDPELEGRAGLVAQAAGGPGERREAQELLLGPGKIADVVEEHL